MTQEDAWRLFFATGLPQAYLIARMLAEGEQTLARPAFSPERGERV